MCLFYDRIISHGIARGDFTCADVAEAVSLIDPAFIQVNVQSNGVVTAINSHRQERVMLPTYMLRQIVDLID